MRKGIGYLVPLMLALLGIGMLVWLFTGCVVPVAAPQCAWESRDGCVNVWVTCSDGDERDAGLPSCPCSQHFGRLPDGGWGDDTFVCQDGGVP